MRAAATAAGGGKEGECGGSGAGAGSADPRWRPGESERARAGSGRAGRGPRAGEGGRAGLCGARRSPAVREPGGTTVGAAGAPEPWSLRTPLAGPENCTPARSGTTATGAEAFVARSGPPPSPPSAPPAWTLGTRPRPAGPGRGGLVRMPPAALRFCGVLAAVAASHDNKLASAEGPGGRSAWRPAQASSRWGGVGGWRLGQRGRRSRAFPLSALPAPDGGLLVKRVQAGALPR